MNPRRGNSTAACWPWRSRPSHPSSPLAEVAGSRPGLPSCIWGSRTRSRPHARRTRPSWSTISAGWPPPWRLRVTRASRLTRSRACAYSTPPIRSATGWSSSSPGRATGPCPAIREPLRSDHVALTTRGPGQRNMIPPPRPRPRHRPEPAPAFTIDDARCATWASARAQIEARRWQRVGRAIVAHNGPLTEREKWRAALINSGPRAVLTSFTAAQAHGLTGWHRNEIHVLVPGGARIHPVPALNVQVHYASSWDATERVEVRSLHALAPALLVAAGSLAPRPACGLLAAAVQQRRTSAVTLSAARERAPRQKHRRLLIGCCHDIGQGAQALSEIDFVRLCRRFGLPRPIQQMVRVEPTGQRRYLDAA